MKPKLRALDIKRVRQGGREYLHLRDPMSLSGEELLAPVQLIPLLALSDGQRDLASIRTAAMLLHGLSVTQEQVNAFFGRLDEALLLEGSRFEEARRTGAGGSIEELIVQDCRHLAGPSYPADPGGIGDGCWTDIWRWCKGGDGFRVGGRDDGGKGRERWRGGRGAKSAY